MTNGPSEEADRVPVYGAWQASVGPLLSLGMLTAAARQWKGGVLNHRFELRRQELAAEVLEDLAGRSGPAVLLCSDYVWSLEHNLDLARAARRLNPEVLVVHGGPCSPKYPTDATAFLAAHGDVADVLVRGEGEIVLCQLLEALDPSALPLLDHERLCEVPGLTYRHPDTGDVVRTPDQERIADLDALPSPYLTGEFDHLPAEAWDGRSANLESNRGCPYGCTFCDWGSATMSRIRKFDLDRVEAEVRWAAERRIGAIQLCDANFGIMSRDVEIARRIAGIRQDLGWPRGAAFTPAKNTTKHLAKALDHLLDAGVLVSAAISLQTTDPGVLEAVARQNISLDAYLTLAADLRRRGLPLHGDVLLGLPGQTYETYRSDLQFFFDHEIMARTWTVKVLPNAPLNDPAYREQWQIVVDEHDMLRSTATYSEADRERMLRLRDVETICERMGLLRHVARWLQWDHGVPASELFDHLVDLTDRHPHRVPMLTWVLGHFDLHPTAPVGWGAVLGELRSVLVNDFGVAPDDSAMECVLQLQRVLMPSPGRRFPLATTLAHDYVEYYRSATRSLYTTGRAGLPEQPLRAYGPASFTVKGDPLQLCTVGLHFPGDSRDPAMEGDFHVGTTGANELESPLMRLLPGMGGDSRSVDGPAHTRAVLAELGVQEPEGGWHAEPRRRELEVRPA